MPEPDPPPPPLEVNPQQYAPQAAPPPQQQPESARAGNLNQGMAQPPGGIPEIDHPDKLKGMKPGSLFRAPDGRLKIVPLAAGAS